MAGSRILLIDDLRHFKPSILASLEVDAQVVVCRSSQEALELLASDTGSWDQVWLDHDLGLVSGEEDTAMAVVDYLLFREREANPVDVKSFVIHSSNTVGVKNIAAALRSSGHEPIIVDASDFFYVPTD